MFDAINGMLLDMLAAIARMAQSYRHDNPVKSAECCELAGSDPDRT
jgi:hypothetical protein